MQKCKNLRYDVNQRKLPWRTVAADPSVEDDRRGYAVWVSEVMLQQTQVATVVEYYKRWMEEWPDTKSLSEASLDDVNRVWSGLGYYSRARRLWEGARKVEETLGGKMPRDSASLQRDLPGVGRYTACAVASIAYGERSAVVDGNVARVVSRLTRMGADPSGKVGSDHLWSTAGQLIDPERPGDFNQAVMELGATVCTPKNPTCGSCPVSSLCSALTLQKRLRDENMSHLANAVKSTGDIEDVASSCELCLPAGDGGYVPSDGVANFPRKARKKDKREERSLVCLVSIGGGGEEDEFLVWQRPQAGLLAGLLEFPTFDLRRDDDTSLTKDPVLEHLRSSVSSKCLKQASVSRVGELLHVFSHIRKTYVVWKVHLDAKPQEVRLPEEYQKHKWLSPAQLADSAISTAMKKVFKLGEEEEEKGKKKISRRKTEEASNKKKQRTIASYFAPKKAEK